MVDQEQQDFEAFDEFARDEEAVLEAESAYSPVDPGRKKRQTVFYISAVLMALIASTAGWFVFMGPSTPQDPYAPVPLTSQPSSPVESQTSPPAGGVLPPGVITPEEMATTNDEMEPSELADAFITEPAPEPMTEAIEAPPIENSLPEEQMMNEESIMPVDGTMAEALPPPAPELLTPTDSATMPQEEFEAPMEPVMAPEIAQPVPEQMPAAQNSLMPLNPVETQLVANTAATDARLAQMEQQIQSLTAELSAAREAMSNMQSTAPPASNNNDALSRQLRDLDNKMDRVTKQVENLDERTTRFAAELQQRADEPVKRAEPAKPVAKLAPKPAASTSSAAPKAAATVSSWQLRSAQPGVAWLSRSGSDEMGRYAVGQTVPNLGTVQEVTKENGAWVVKTTGGIIRQ